MTERKKTACVILFFASAFLVLTMLAQSCAEGAAKRNHLGYFKMADSPSISSDGDQLLFTGCGHSDYHGCTINRYDRKENVLYRYVHVNPQTQVMDGRYWSDSKSMLCMVIPRDRNRKQLLEDIQIAVVNPDGTGLKELTQGKGVKTAYMLSPDGQTLVFAKGRERTEGKTAASHFDYYARNIVTGKETQITNFSFYEAGIPTFTLDGRNVLFNYGGLMRLPNMDNGTTVRDFRDAYERKYQNNRIVQYPIDGSGRDSLPEPWYSHGFGSCNPIITRDGSFWFRGETGGIHQYRRYPSGRYVKFTDEELAELKTRGIFRMTVEPGGRWAAVIYQDLEGYRARHIGVFDASARRTTMISIPAAATNITIH